MTPVVAAIVASLLFCTVFALAYRALVAADTADILAAHQSELNQLRQANQELNATLDQLEEQSAQLNQYITSLEDELSTTQAHRDELNRQVEEAEADLSDALAGGKSCEAELDGVQELLSDVCADLELLQGDFQDLEVMYVELLDSTIEPQSL